MMVSLHYCWQAATPNKMEIEISKTTILHQWQQIAKSWSKALVRISDPEVRREAMDGFLDSINETPFKFLCLRACIYGENT